MKRLLIFTTLLLCPLLTFAQFTGTVSDSQGVKYTANYDESTCYVSGHENTYSATITIPEIFGRRRVTSIGSGTFFACSGLTSLTIPSSVTSIGEAAFDGCSGLTSLTIPSSVTSIGYGAFDGTPWFDNQPDGLVYINNVAYRYKGKIPENTSIEIKEGTLTISDRAFQDCSGLTSVTIPSSVTSIGEGAFIDCSGLTSVTIPSSVSSIGSNAFYNCSGLTSLTIPSSVTSIGEFAFEGCSGLTSLTIPSSVTSIGGCAFRSCTGLTSIIVEEGNSVFDSRDHCNAIIKTSDNTLIVGCKNTNIPSSVTSIGGSAFSGCSGLTSLTIPSSVTSIGGGAFSGCSGLTSLTIPLSVTSIGGRAFKDCSGLTSVTIPSSVTSIGEGAFIDCSGLTSVTIPSSVSSIGSNAFYNCSGLTSLTIPSSVTSIGWAAFSGCSGLTSLTIPEAVTSIGNYAFNGCSGLTSLTIPSSVTSIEGRAFYGCNGLIAVNVNWETPLQSSGFANQKKSTVTLSVPKGSKALYEVADGWKDFGEIVEQFDISDGALSDSQGLQYTANNDESTCYVSGHDASYNSLMIIPRFFRGRQVTSISADAFADCNKLNSLTVPWEIPIEITGSVFEGSNCHEATLYVPKGSKAAYEAAEVWKDFVTIKEIFSQTDGDLGDSQGVKYKANDDDLTCNVSGHEDNYNETIVIPEVFEGRRVTSIGFEAFSGCSGLTSLTIPLSVTSIGGRAFKDCSGLTSVVIPSGVMSISDYAFYGCGLTSLTIPEAVTSIGNYAFNGCSGLTSLTIPSSVTSIGWAAFSGCSGLTSLTIPEAVTSIGNYAFNGCSGLTSLTIPEAVTSIGNYAFNGCSGLTSLTIPSSVTSIGDNAFWKCSGLTSLTISSGVTSIGSGAFLGCSSLTSLTIPSSVTSIGRNAFSDCSSLTSIIVDEGNTVYDSRDNCNAIIKTSDNTLITGCNNTVIPSSVTSIGDVAFSSCSGLTSLTIPSSVTSIGYYAFSDCSSLTSVTISEGVTRIGDYAFNGCSGLTSLTIPSSVTSIGYYAFSKCSGLTSLTIPEGVTSIGSGTFFACSGLTSLTIPSSVTSIGEAAFYNCRGLTSLTIPLSVTSIGINAFAHCSVLTSVIVGWDTPLGIDGRVFIAPNNSYRTLYVPKATKAAYEAAAVWQVFGEIVEYDRPQENVEATDVAAVDNVIYMESFEATKGKEVTVPLRMKNTAGIRGFQFDMQLPLGVTVAKDGNNRPVAALNSRRLPEGSAHTLTVSEQADGSVRFLCASQYDETLTGTDGEMLTVRLCLDPHMLDGQYPVVLKDVTLSETNINNFYKTETVQTTMTVISYTPGDISGDDEIDVSDYIGVANYIMGNTPTGFVAAAADVNKDNTVDVLDYIGIANLILYNSVYGNNNVNASRRDKRRAVTDVSTLNNVVYITPFEAASNGETQVSIKMKNTVGIRGFQFDLYLPEGITAKKDGNNRIVCTLNNGRKPNGDQHTLTMSEQPDGAIRFLCGSQYDETFTGTDGEIATLTISVAADVEADNYPIYLRNMKLTETDINNYYTTNEIETSVTVTGPADGRVVLRETATSLPVVDETEEVDVVVYRTLKAGEWSTICLPFDMDEDQMKEFFGDEVQLAKYSNYSTTKTGLDVTGISISFTAVDLADDGFEANVPYIIKPSKTEDITSFELTTMVAPDNVKAGSNKKGWFYGTYAAETVVPEYSLFLSGNKFYYSTGLTKMKAFRAYLSLPEHLADAASAASRIRMSYDDETTSVKELKSSRIEGLKSCYNLKGQRVEQPVKKGVYIRDGKKVVIK